MFFEVIEKIPFSKSYKNYLTNKKVNAESFLIFLFKNFKNHFFSFKYSL